MSNLTPETAAAAAVLHGFIEKLGRDYGWNYTMTRSGNAVSVEFKPIAATAAANHSETPKSSEALDPNRCACCGWPLVPSTEMGCHIGDCSNLAEDIIDELFDDLNDRKGLELNSLDADTQEDIFGSWMTIIRKHLQQKGGQR